MSDLKLPEIYPACAHPQSVWFHEHWRPVFEKLQSQLEACRKERDVALEALKKIAAYFDCLSCELSEQVCAEHLDDRMEIARKAIADIEGKSHAE